MKRNTVEDRLSIKVHKPLFSSLFLPSSTPTRRCDLIKAFGSNTMTLRPDSAEQRPYLSNVGTYSTSGILKIEPESF